jgi:hypothetical protein
MIIDELPLTDEMVSTYLQDNPDFFTRNPELLSSLRMQDNNRGVVSLVTRQQQHLRDKVHLLEEEITQLLAVANNNEHLFTVYSDLYLQLIDCNSLAEMLDCLHQTTTQLLSLADCKVWLNSTINCEHPVIINDNCQDILSSRLANNDYYFGRLQKSEIAQLFHHNDIFACAQTGSVALIKLQSASEPLGFIAISSQDAEHFDPRMDTLLLNQFSKLVAKLLAKKL